MARGSEGKALLLDALSLARNIESPEWEFASLWGLFGISDLSHEERTNLTNEYHARSRQGVSVNNLASTLATMVTAHLANGDRAEALELSSELEAIANETRNTRVIHASELIRRVLRILDGAIEESDLDFFGLAQPSWGAAVASWLGKEQRELPVSGEDSLQDRVLAALVLARRGEVARADQQVAVLTTEFPDLESSAHVEHLVNLLETAFLIGDRVVCERLYSCLRKRGLGTPLSNFATRPQQRIMGSAATLLSHFSEAKDFFGQAAELCKKIGHRPELALSRAHLAELLLDHYPDERDAAIEHLDFAIAEFQDMKMQPAPGAGAGA